MNPKRSSVPDPVSVRKFYTRFPHSIFRKTKEAEPPLKGKTVISTKSITSAFIYTAADLSVERLVLRIIGSISSLLCFLNAIFLRKWRWGFRACHDCYLLLCFTRRSEIVARLKRDFLPTTVNGLMYWPVCDFLTFKFFPVHLQPLVSNSFSYIWTVYMIYMASLEKVATD